MGYGSLLSFNQGESSSIFKKPFTLGLQGLMKLITAQSKQSTNINALSTQPAYSPLFSLPGVSGALL